MPFSGDSGCGGGWFEWGRERGGRDAWGSSSNSGGRLSHQVRLGRERPTVVVDGFENSPLLGQNAAEAVVAMVLCCEGENSCLGGVSGTVKQREREREGEGESERERARERE